MTMNPTMNPLNKVNLMDENKANNIKDKAPATQIGGAMHGGNGIGGNGSIGTAVPQHNGGTTPIFIDIENLDLTVICGNQENYHENINGGFGCMQGGQQMNCDGECYDDCDCYDEDWGDDDFDELNAPEDEDPPCNTCDFSEECLKNSIESGDNIFLDQIIRKMAFIADVPISTAMMVLNAYLTLCSIFDEEPPVRFKKRKYDVHRIPIGLDDLTNRIHKAATALAYGLADEENKDAARKSVKATASQQELNRSKISTSAASDEKQSKDDPKPQAHESIPDEILDALPDPVKAILKDAPDELKKIVSRACEKGKELHIIHIDVKDDEDDKDGEAGESDENAGDGNESSQSGKAYQDTETLGNANTRIRHLRPLSNTVIDTSIFSSEVNSHE